MRLGIGPAEPAIDGVTGAKDRGSLLIGNLVRNQVGGVGIHQHVLGVTALYIDPRALQIGTKHPAATLAPFAAPTRGLNPCGAHAIPYFPRYDVRGDRNDLTDRPLAQ